MNVFLKILTLPLFSLILLILGACAHYTNVTEESLPFKTIYIDPANNNSFAPNVQVLFDAQIRQKILESGRIQIVQDLAEADCQLFVRLENYSRSPIGRSSTDPGRVSALNTSLRAVVSFYDTINDRYLIKDYPLVNSEPIFFPETSTESSLSDTKEGEYRVLPNNIDQLTEAITQLILMHW